MVTFQVAWAFILAFAWLPIARKFQGSWKARKNPVSLAICVVILVLTYSNAVFALALAGSTSWRFYAIASRTFELIALGNFYLSFRWAERHFPDARGSNQASGTSTKT